MKDAGRDLLDTGWQEGPTGLAYIFRAIGRNFFTLLLTPLLFIAAKRGFGQEILALSDARPKAFSTLDVDGDHHCHMDSCVEEVAEAVVEHFLSQV